MVSSVVDQVVEQAEGDAPQVEEVAPVEPEAVSTEADTPDVEASEPEAVPDPEPEAERPDLSELDLKTLRELRPDLIEAQDNATVQRERDKARKEAGNAENTRAAVAESLRRAGVDPASIEDQSQLNYLYSNALANSQDLVARTWTEAAVGKYISDPPTRDTVLAPLEELSGATLVAQFDRIFDAAVTAVSTEQAGGLEFKDVPQDSVLYQGMTAEVKRLVAEELQAQGVEAKGTSDPAPQTPQGSPAGSGGADPLLTKLEEHGADALTDAERAEARKRLGF